MALAEHVAFRDILGLITVDRILSLVHKMDDTQDSIGGKGQVMPKSGLLPQADRYMLRAWINQGALNN